jgi:hypothetical protein
LAAVNKMTNKLRLTIPSLREQNLPPSQDARFLQEEARRRIEELASELWTDYNTHDPGITLLEILSYAITDLGLRTRLEIPDYLAGGEARPFYTAAEILPNAALTPNDYRRLLISLTELKFAAGQAIPIIRDIRLTSVPGAVHGLYALHILFEGDLNESWIEQEIMVEDDKGNVIFETIASFVPPIWKNLPEPWFTGNDISSISVADDKLERVEDDTLPTRYFAEARVFIDEANELDLPTWIFTTVPVPASDDSEIENAAEIEAGFREAVLACLRSLEGENPQNDPDIKLGVYSRFLSRTKEILNKLQDIRLLLNQNRNLCEDWESFQPVRIQQVAVCVEELELQPTADPVEVLAQIYWSLEQFIVPQLRPHRLGELLDRGKEASEIFLGPLLDRGLILEEDLQELEQRRDNNLYTSDLVRLIMRVSGVFALEGLTLRSFVDRLEINRDVVNCLKLLDPREFYPRLSILDCTINPLRRGTPLAVDIQDVIERLEELREDFRSTFPSTPPADLPVPRGEVLDIETFYSIQNEFPAIYGLRAGEIVKSAPALRRAQAKQLKAYLLFFEQILANFCSQLANLQELFSMRKDVEHTYFHQPLYNVPAVQKLFADFLRAQNESPPVSWEVFQTLCNTYIKALVFGNEDQEVYRTRRNTFVEHLIARFGERFGEYANWVLAQNNAEISSDLLMDQLEFLAQFPVLSRRRAVAFDYSVVLAELGPDVWDTENVSGLEKRVCRLLGMPDCRRRFLASVFDILDYLELFDERFDEETETLVARFRFWNAPLSVVIEEPASHKILLTSTDAYPVDPENGELTAEMASAVREVVALAQHGRYYSVSQSVGTRSQECNYEISLRPKGGQEGNTVAVHNGDPTSRSEVEEIIRDVIHLMQGRHTEGMHLVEHALLRPKGEAVVPLNTVHFTAEGKTLEPFVTEPYSFQVSIFLPGWAPRFANREFRGIVERTIRSETPAHILPWIYWVNPVKDKEGNPVLPPEFVTFEVKFKSWLEHANDYLTLTTNESVLAREEFVQAFNALIDLREQLIPGNGEVTIVELTNTYQPYDIES